MKKIFSFLMCIMLLLAVGCGCGEAPQTESIAFTLEQSTDMPSLFDDTAESPLGLYDETTAFGIVVQTNKEGIVLEMQNKYFLFHWTEHAKKCYDTLEVNLMNEVGVHFEIKDGKLFANSIDLVTGAAD